MACRKAGRDERGEEKRQEQVVLDLSSDVNLFSSDLLPSFCVEHHSLSDTAVPNIS